MRKTWHWGESEKDTCLQDEDESWNKMEGSPCLSQLGMFVLANTNVSLLCSCLSDCESAVSIDYCVPDIIASGWICKNGICEYFLFINL